MDEPITNITYEKILGHDRPIEVLKAAIKNNRVAHAYLFAGPDGVGKRTCAMAFAAALNCETNSDSPCGTCLSCRKILKSNHPDINVVKRDGNFIKIEQVRDIGKQSNYRPHEGRCRVYIILEAEGLNINAANALLKTLEEPRPNNILILVSANPQQLLPTILSRCQRINFGSLAFDQIEKIIHEQMGYDDLTGKLLARLSDGSVGWVMQADVEGLVEKRRELLTTLANLDPKSEVDIVSFGESLLEAGPDIQYTFELLKTFVRDAAIIAIGENSNRLINIDIVDEIRSYSSRFDPIRLLSMGRSIGYAQRLLIRNVNKSFIATSLALELVHPYGAGLDEKRMPR